MCDEITEAENEALLRRREWGVGATAAVAAAMTGCRPNSATGDAAPTAEPAKHDAEPATHDAEPAQNVDPSSASDTTSRRVTIKTPDGEAEAFFVAPSSGGSHPAVLIWPDIAGLRASFESMATRLAGRGYAVVAVNHYYRSSKLPVLSSFAEWRTPEGRAKIGPMVEALTPAAITSDAAAFVAWLDTQPEVDTARKIGTTGYCMGGPFTFRSAAAVPDRIGVIGSFHGGGLVTEAPDSPHAMFPKMNAAALICIAQNDDERDPEAKSKLEQAAASAGRSAEVEVYAAPHGWCVSDSPVYAEAEAERAWTRLLVTLEKNL